MIKIYNSNNKDFVSPYGTAYKLNNLSSSNIIYSEIPTDGLVFYASLNKSSELAETGQSITAVGNVSYQEVNETPCCYFDGSSYLQFGNNNIPTGTSNFTISFWKKNNNSSSEECDFIIGTTSTNSCFGSWINSSFYQTCTAHGGSTLDNFSVPLEFGKFVHIILTRDGNNFSLYINGELKQNVTYTGSISSNPIFYIGRYITNMMYFVGYQLAYRIYNRVLSQEEISLLTKEFENLL